MADRSKASGRSGLAAVAAAAGLALLLSGCAYSLSEFALERPADPASAVAVAPEATGAIPLEPAALVDQEEPLPPPAPRASAAVAATARVAAPQPSIYPAPGPPPGQPESNLLTPEEKARVIAELEALARSQKVTPPSPPEPKSRCTDETLDAAERLRREVEGIAC